MAEHVRVTKREYASAGGDAADETEYIDEIDVNEDHIDARGLFLQGDSGADEVVHLTRDASGRATFKDSENVTPVTLSTMLSGGGISADQHKTLRQLIHFIDNGPAEGFTPGAYRETTGTVFPTVIIWWESSSKLKKIVEKLITYTGAFPTTIAWNVYDVDGSTMLATVSDLISYSGPFETSRTRTITVY